MYAMFSKRSKVQHTGTLQPLKIMTWNVNGLAARLKDERRGQGPLGLFLKRVDPDVILLQEVQHPAAGAKGKGAPESSGAKRHRLGGWTSDHKAGSDVINSAMQVGGVFEAYRIKWSLADWKYGGTAMLLHERCADPINYRFNIDVNGDPKTHHSDGRVICAEFERFFLLNTYTPNKSHKNLKLREAWDTAITSFVKSISSKDKPLVYGGDLNIAPFDYDVSHPTFFRVTMASRFKSVDKGDSGQPAVTENERKAFKELLSQGNLVDAYRVHHPIPDDPTVGGDTLDITAPVFSWRGAGFDNAWAYGGKGLRIDHFLVSESFADQVAAVEILGRYDCKRQSDDAGRIDFFGSDHCPMVLTLKGTGG